jgi:hypothetical protein
VVQDFRPAGRPDAFGPDGFTTFDATEGSLYAVQRAAGGFAARRVEGAGAVHSSLESADGVLSILSWNGASRRVVLLEGALTSRGPRRSTVTVCDGTTTVSLLPGPTRGTYLILFDESRREGARQVYAVSLIAPAAAFQMPGARYRKSVLFESERPIDGFAAVQTPDALYVLVQSAGMTLVRTPIRGAPQPVS